MGWKLGQCVYCMAFILVQQFALNWRIILYTFEKILKFEVKIKKNRKSFTIPVYILYFLCFVGHNPIIIHICRTCVLKWGKYYRDLFALLFDSDSGWGSDTCWENFLPQMRSKSLFDKLYHYIQHNRLYTTFLFENLSRKGKIPSRVGIDPGIINPFLRWEFWENPSLDGKQKHNSLIFMLTLQFFAKHRAIFHQNRL